MKRGTTALGIAMVLALTSAIAAAEGPSNSPGGTSSTASPSGKSPSVPDMQVTPPSTPDPAQVVTPAAVETRLNEIRNRARAMTITKRESVEKQVKASSKRVDTEAAKIGEVPVRNRIAAEFGMSPEALVAEREQSAMGWGELLIAHTLIANSNGDLTLDQVRTLRSEGFGWGQLAHGLGLNPDGFVTAVKNEVSVARGTAKPDGKPAQVASATSTKGSQTAKTNEATPPAPAKSDEIGTPSAK